MKKLNVRLIGGLVLATAVLGGAAFVLHGFQTERHAGAYLREARRAQEEKRPQDALQYLRRYINLAPHDTEGLGLYGQQLADLGHLQQAYLILGQALRREPDRTEWRRRSVEVALGLGRFSDARAGLQDYLLKAAPRDAALLAQLGVCQAALGENTKAVEAFEAAIEAAPGELENYAALAGLQQTRLKDPAAAMQTLDRMVDSNTKNYRAYLVRGQWHLDQSRTVSAPKAAEDAADAALDSVWRDAQRAVELAPDLPETALFAARVALARGRHDEARSIALRALELWPSIPDVYSFLAQLETAAGQKEQAVDWLRRGMVAAPANAGLRWNLAQFLVEQGHADEAKDEIKRLRAANYAAAPLRYLDARVAIASGQWLEAVRQLEDNRSALAAWPDLQKQSDYWSGRCYAELGSVDQQLEAFRRAVATDPDWVPARLGVADALMTSGRLQEALNHYRQIVSLPQSPLAAHLRLAQAVLGLNLRTDASKRDWGEFDRLLDRIEEVNPGSPQVALLRADGLLAQGRVEDAKSLITDARKRNPGQLELLAAQIMFAQREKDWPRVDELLADGEAQIDDKVGLLLVRARTCPLRYEADAGAELKKLWEGSSADLPQDQKIRLAEGLASLAFAIGQLDLAEELGLMVAGMRPDDLQIRLFLLDVGFQGDRSDLVKRILADVRKLEGEGPLFHYGEAIRLISAAKDGDSRLLAEAQTHLVAAKVARPAWTRIPILSAEISASQGDLDRACEAYLEAISLGERRASVIGRAVALLFKQERFIEADQIIHQMQEQQLALTGDLARIAAATSLRVQDYDRALDLARSVANDSGRFQDHVWAGRLFALQGRLEEAEQAFRQAAALDVSQPDPWIALVQVLVQAGKREEAELVIKEARASLAESPSAAALAQCYEILGQTDAAEAAYKDALKRSPEDGTLMQRLIEFYLRARQTQQAEPYLRSIVSGDVDVSDTVRRWARRNLALIVSARGGNGFAEATALLNANAGTGEPSAEDERARALVLAAQPSRQSRQQAAELLAKLLVTENSASHEDRFVLAELYRQNGDLLEAADQLRKILAAYPDDLRSLLSYAQVLLERGELSEAELWFDRLKSLAPHELSTAGVEARLLYERGRHKELAELLGSVADQSVVNAETPGTPDAAGNARQLWAAQQLDGYSQRFRKADQSELAASFAAQAEKLLAQHVEQTPADRMLLAAFVVRQGQIERALDLLPEQFGANDQRHLSRFAAAVATSDKARPEDLERLQKRLEEVEAQTPAVAVEIAIADTRSWRGDYAGAVAMYQEALKKSNTHVAALNNLAFVLAMGLDRCDEAMGLIQQAIEISGPNAQLLDTRGLVHLAAGRPEDARKDFERAISEEDTADKNLHLFMALSRLGNMKGAKQALDKAQRLGLTESQLHPLERSAMRQAQLATR